MKKLLIVGFSLVSFFTAWMATGTFCIAEERFPTRPIIFSVAYPPGGSGDIPVRYLADFASKTLGQPVVVVNKAGGGGALAWGELKNATPDGYTIGMLNASGIISTHMRKSPYHPIQDFEPIMQYSGVVTGLVVPTDSPFKTLKDLLVYAKTNPSKVTYSSTGVGSPQHMVMILLGKAANVEWTHVPFSGGVQAITALLGGHVTSCASSSVFKPYVDSGRMRLLAAFMEKRLTDYQDVPTLIELGYNITAPSLFCVVAPKGIPKDRVQILHDCFYKGIKTAEFKQVLNKLSMEIYYRNPEDTKKYIRDIYEMTGEIMKKHSNEIRK